MLKIVVEHGEMGHFILQAISKKLTICHIHLDLG